MSVRRTIGILCALVSVTAFCLVFRYLRDNRQGNFTRQTDLYVYPATTASQALEQVDSVARHPRALRCVFRRKRVAEFIKPGHYTVDESTSSVALARMLNNGWQTPVSLTLSGTLRLRDEIAARISRQLMISRETVRSAFEDEELLAQYGFTPENVFALFIPDTYSCYWTASMKDILDIQKKAYDAFWTEENDAKARKLGLSRMEVSILASIVKGETNFEPEMPKIAGVYLNRLDRGVLLQADPTVAFCYDYTLDRILKSHLSVDSPYNTYKHGGLPPGPIYIPTRACLEAVLNPDRGNGNFFFCASPEFDGTHRFARNMAEHNANAAAFHKALTARKRAKSAASSK
ncbi:MAG: endolytic transglycosylase MltG [Bacteroidales bacterium]|nr:endolytic transglycosylase MltG [Bacteroidales bacterium]